MRLIELETVDRFVGFTCLRSSHVSLNLLGALGAHSKFLILNDLIVFFKDSVLNCHNLLIDKDMTLQRLALKPSTAGS